MFSNTFSVNICQKLMIHWDSYLVSGVCPHSMISWDQWCHNIFCESDALPSVWSVSLKSVALIFLQWTWPFVCIQSHTSRSAWFIEVSIIQKHGYLYKLYMNSCAFFSTVKWRTVSHNTFLRYSSLGNSIFLNNCFLFLFLVSGHTKNGPSLHNFNWMCLNLWTCPYFIL